MESELFNSYEEGHPTTLEIPDEYDSYEEQMTKLESSGGIE